MTVFQAIKLVKLHKYQSKTKLFIKCCTIFRPQRANIAIGTARGLNYLHSQTPCVVHGDIKSTNILLDCHFEPKIADFGITTCNFKNKICKLDMDVKSIDTYCYGVILFEMVTGKTFFKSLCYCSYEI